MMDIEIRGDGMSTENAFTIGRMKQICVDGLVGQAVGDAFGVPFEFMSRQEVRAVNLHEMIGKDDPRDFTSRWGDLIPAGAWSDDTSMTAASMASVAIQGGKIDYDDQMRQFLNWWEKGMYTALDFPFGLGATVSRAMERYLQGYAAAECGGTGYRDNGNGSLMRILPFSLYCILNGFDFQRTAEITGKGSALTHGHGISRMSCLIFTEYLRALVQGKEPLHALEYVRSLDYGYLFETDVLRNFELILSPDFVRMPEEQIGENGFVLDTLKGALFSLIHSTGYEEAILTVVNLGYDTDTTAAVTGALAGVAYGYEAIPERWLAALRKREWLIQLGEQFADAVWKRRTPAMS